MKTLSMYDVMQRKVRDDLLALPNPDEHTFDRFTVEATAVLASYGDSLQNDMACICARGLLSWEQNERDEFLANHDVPGRVFQQMANPDPWPFITTEEPTTDDPD